MKNDKDGISDILFKKREEEIFINRKEQEYIIGEKLIDLTDIIVLTNDKNLINNLYKYEEQNNLISAEYIEIFYKQRIL